MELLFTLSIMAILAVLVASGLQSAFGAGFGSEVSDIASTFMRARSYAIANNTYTFVGVTEVSASTPASSAQTTGSGRIGVVVYATNDGTRGYDPTTTTLPIALPQTAVAPFTNTKLVVVAPLRHFDNIHLTTLTTAIIGKFGSSYPITSTTMTYNSYYDLATTTLPSQTTMSWPVSGSALYSFGGTNPGSIIQFNPQGEAQVFTGANTDSYYQWIEMDLVPIHGSNVPATTPANQGSIVIDGASGAVSIYRP